MADLLPQDPSHQLSHRGVHPISWEEFHGICKALAVAVSAFQPDIILPIGRGGYYPGTLLSHMLQVEIYPVRVSRRVRDIVRYDSPKWVIEPPAEIAGRRVLIVDEIADSGETILMVKEKVISRGASQARSAVLYAHTRAIAVPDYIGLITDALVLNPWDREILRDGVFHYHPEYLQSLSDQGVSAEHLMRIQATEFRLAKG